MNNIADIFFFSTNAILPIILIILLGYLLKRKHFFTEEFLKIGNKTVFRICLPLLLFSNIAEMDSLEGIQKETVFYVLGIIALLVLLGVLFASRVPEKNQKGVILQCVFRSNFAMIGVPLAELIAGTKGIQAAAMLSVFTIPVYNVLAVIALSVYKKDKMSFSVKEFLGDIVRNPLIIGVVSGIVVLVLKPVFTGGIIGEMLGKFSGVYTAITYIARAATPLSLLILGGQFEFTKISGYKKQIMLGVLGRVVIAPVLGIGIAVVLTLKGILHFDGSVFSALIALFGTPVAVSSAIMAEEMENDGKLAGQLVVWTSLLSAVSIFAMIFLVRAAGLL